MASKKYIPPHKRRSSQNKPPPSSMNDRFSDNNRNNYNNNNYGNRWRQNARVYNGPNRNRNQNRINNTNNHQYSSQRFNNHNQNSNSNNFNNRTNQRFQFKNQQNKNEKTLEEKAEISAHDAIETINLDKYIIDRQKYRQTIIQIVSEFTNNIHTAQLIYAICSDDMILIPNTFDRDEFLKYWYIMNKGSMMNQYRDYHRVDLYPDYLQLIQRGTIAAIKCYKPSKNAKLKVECKFRFTKDSTDVMWLVLKGGSDRTHWKYIKYGHPYHEDVYVVIGQENWKGFSVYGKDNDGMKMEMYPSEIVPQVNAIVSIVMIDDGNTMEVTGWIDNKFIFKEEADSSVLSQNNRILVFNRERADNICDILYLQCSIVV